MPVRLYRRPRLAIGGAVVQAFTPASLSGLEFWVHGDVGVTTDAEGVNDWADQSGNSRDVTQSTGSSKPQLVSAELNGHDVVSFDGGDFLRSASFTVIAQPCTWWCVGKFDSASPQWDYLFGAVDATNRQLCSAEDLAADKVRIWSGSANVTGPVIDTNWNYYVLTFNGASSSIRQNGSEIVTGNPGSNGIAGITLGANYVSPPTAITFLAGDLADVGFTSTAISGDDLTDLETYLSDRYSI